jgi:hypothetical protein
LLVLLSQLSNWFPSYSFAKNLSIFSQLVNLFPSYPSCQITSNPIPAVKSLTFIFTCKIDSYHILVIKWCSLVVHLSNWSSFWTSCRIAFPLLPQL